ncbi:MAG: hypothetical protein ABI651_13360 [Verrucomicrobiota bacterium]
MKTSSSFIFKGFQYINIRGLLLALVWFSLGTICVFADPPAVTIVQPAGPRLIPRRAPSTSGGNIGILQPNSDGALWAVDSSATALRRSNANDRTNPRLSTTKPTNLTSRSYELHPFW